MSMTGQAARTALILCTLIGSDIGIGTTGAQAFEVIIPFALAPDRPLPPPDRLTKPVDMYLCLAADVSESVTPQEYNLQKFGHASAITDPHVLDVIRNGVHGRIAALYVEWADQNQQFLGADWHMIEDQRSAKQFADTIKASPPPPWIGWTVRNTSTSEVVRYCLDQFDRASASSSRRVIDISSDGTNNVGRRIDGVRDEAVSRGVVINALAIEDSLHPFANGAHTRPDGGLVQYFKSNVVGGIGSFVQTARGYSSFGEMIKRKFILELASAGQ